ncbi:FecR family protein [Parapedobacter lycopersici]|uniref:FecR family protein n=1 Tax=Parapedobacter lycopersici TaxID=1864939 RepID=UPI00214D1671|nr:FecR family protein [Parapedobacter lycopersici]
MKLNQYQVAVLISKYLRNDISEEDHMVLEQWLDEKEENRLLLESFRNGTHEVQHDMDFIRSLDAETAWESFEERVQQRRWKRMMRYVGYAAAIVVVAGLAIWKFLPGSSDADDAQTANVFHNDVAPGSNKAQLTLSDGSTVDLETYINGLQEQDGTAITGSDGQLTYSTPGDAANELIYNTLVIPKAGTYQLTLSDGTKVWLNAMSELRFPVQFGGKERRVYLKGEAYFEVAHDAGRPFRVAVNDTEVEVLGTHFNINSYAQVTTTLVEGSVKIYKEEEEQLLTPGQEAKVGEHISVYKANMDKVIAWKNGDFYFKSDNMVEIMEQLSRWYDIEVNYRGNIPLNAGYNGSISRNVNLSEVLEMLTFASGALFSIDQKQVSVTFNK